MKKRDWREQAGRLVHGSLVDASYGFMEESSTCTPALKVLILADRRVGCGHKSCGGVGRLGSRCVPVRHADVFYSSPWCGRSGTYLCLWHRERVPLSGAQLDGAFYHASVGCRKRNCARRASFDGGSEVECAGRSEIPRVGNRVSVASRGNQPINGASACSRGYECRARANSA